MAKKTFVPKLKVLELIEKAEIIGPTTLVNNFNITPRGAAKRIYRLQKAGLVEPLTTERGKWVLTNKGYQHLDFLRAKASISLL